MIRNYQSSIHHLMYANWNMFAIVPAKTRVTLIENFASRKTVKEKLNDRRIAEPPMDENSKKIRELTEAMHAEGYQDPQ